ncbi:hypothetical protein JHL21_03705 [Devosia sp. WQ 349]|uniref:methyl-accepting chemotaxis protein n=1 Tax=Devosia sp. WQ 349K1 TaxID=2800329 RepID=UPI001906583E|nr:methyl-accepting chemotaxis protein [Devosia sp. WQ 349K1]MBK1793598.1 hypothetical protein [Devosia sp. WQ 349K1]
MSLELFRSRVLLALSTLCAILAISSIAVEYVRFGEFGMATYLAVALSGMMALGFMLFRLRPTGRHLIVAVLMGLVSASLIAMRGSPMQIDMHMAFFAALAMCSLLYDIRAILVGTALVAVHHLALGLFFSDLVFYGTGGLDRIALHAVILVLEAAALIWMTINTNAALHLAEERTKDAAMRTDEAHASAKEAQYAAETTAHHAEQMQQMQAEFAAVVEAGLAGDFSKRMIGHYDDHALNELVEATNSLVDQIGRGVGATQIVLQSLARADVTLRVEGEFKGVFSDLQDNTNAVAEKLGEIVMQLKQSSNALKDATGEILSGANDLSDRTSRQASTIVGTTSIMAQLAQTVEINEQQANDASSNALAVSQLADEGGKIMQEANQAMLRMTESSQKVGDIVKFIDDIAFQTNLLALNASVEAARAGEAGKSFAVVASEVRRLAQSAGKASGEIKTLIEKSSNDIMGGTKLVADAARTLMTMVETAHANMRVMEAIAQHASGQAISIKDVTSAVKTMDEMTQHNAALVEQMNAAIEQSEAQARELDQIVDIFTTDQSSKRLRAVA